MDHRNPDKIIAAGVTWLKHSGMINREVGSRTFGAFHYGGFLFSRKPVQTYSEITGYGISLLVRLYQQKADTVFLNLAVNAAKHLLEVQLKDSRGRGDGAFAHGFVYRQNRYSADHFSFDTGICLSGLADLYFEKEWPPLVEPLDRAASWLADCAQYEDGSFRACYNSRKGDFEPLPSEADWYNDHCALHAKNSLGLIKAWEITGQPRYKAAALKSLDWVLQLQTAGGAFTINKRSSDVYTHAHCYVLEALFFALAVLKTEAEKYQAAAQKGLSWLRSMLNPDGSLFRYYPARRVWREAVTDATSQTARLMILQPDFQLDPDLARTLRYLAHQQLPRAVGVHAGGSFISKRYTSCNISFPAWKIMSWPTLFTLHVFLMSAHRSRAEIYDGRELF